MMEERPRHNPDTGEPIAEDQIPNVDDFIHDLQNQADRAFGVSETDDTLMDVRVIDRTVYQHEHWFPVKHWFRVENPKESHDIFDTLLTNVHIAVESLRTFMDCMKFKPKHDHDAEPIWEVAKKIAKEHGLDTPSSGELDEIREVGDACEDIKNPPPETSTRV